MILFHLIIDGFYSVEMAMVAAYHLYMKNHNRSVSMKQFDCFKYYKKRIDSNIADSIKKQLKNTITWALIFMALWQLFTNCVVSIYGLLIYIFDKKPDDSLGPYLACLFLTNGMAYVICNTIYVKRFRTSMKKLVLLKRLNAIADSNF
uniref:Uncharacterized protein n=1 Tax=Romanomermis culicivorax TaxID=13658 RepID=A0A915IKI2_ROMCU